MAKDDATVVRLDEMPNHPAIARFEEWGKAAAAGATALQYDAWLVARLYSRERRAVRYESKGAGFTLEHCATYEIDVPTAASRRVFKCLLNGIFPFVAFIDEHDGRTGPWLSGINLLTAPQLRTLWKLATPTFGGILTVEEGKHADSPLRFALTQSNVLDKHTSRH